MGKHSKEGGPTPKAAIRHSLLNSFRPNTTRPNRQPVRHKVMAAMVTAGAFATVTQPLAAGADNSAPDRSQSSENRTPGTAQSQAAQNGAAQNRGGAQNLGAALTGTKDEAPSVRLLGTDLADSDSLTEVRKLDKSKTIERKRIERVEAERKAREAAKRAAEQAAQERAEAQQRAADQAANARAGLVNSAGYVKPTDATFTSGFGSRWGSSHNGIDLANDIGTPIYAVSGGEVIDAGPASGFGQWIRLQHDDGTITVYGHINTIDVSVGEDVEAGQQIATMGSEGQSTGPHLHFEVIEDDEKINPLPWLEERGIDVQ